MITPIGTLNINQIAERKDDLLVSVDDIKELARNERNSAICEFAERFIYKAVCEGCSGCCNCYEEEKQSECEDWKAYMKIAEEMRGA